jgi:hypothetical protein
MWVEASWGFDFFRSFYIKAKRTKEKLDAPVRPLAETPLKFW